MSTIVTLFRADGVNVHGKIIRRTAVRAVIQRGHDLLMVHSAKVGDYKFPGGGVDAGEIHAAALAREVEEECGARLARFGEEIGAIVEYDHDTETETDYDTFMMTSHYYRCEVEDGFGAQRLDGYEHDLGFRPVWIAVDEALRQNKRLLASPTPPEWLRREIFMLEHLAASNK